MTPEEMQTLLREHGTPDRPRTNQITGRKYNVIVRTHDGKVEKTFTSVSMKVAREIRNEVHKENMVADIIEVTPLLDGAIDPNGIGIVCKPISAPRYTAMNTPQFSEEKSNTIRHRNMEKAQDNISRSIKNEKFAYHMYRVISKPLGIDFQNTENKVAEFLVGKNMDDFRIIYCGIAYSWGKEL